MAKGVINIKKNINKKIESTAIAALLPRIDFIQNKEALIEGSKGVIEYDNTSVKINGGKFILLFKGHNLSISALSTEEIIITGEIVSLDFSN